MLRCLRPLDGPGGPRVRRDGRSLWNFAANDYLGLASHPAVVDAFAAGLRRHGAGAGASRLLSGSLPPHRDLEDALAAAKQSDAALLFSSGYAAALGTLPALATHGDTILLDKLCHACLIDGARLSGAAVRVFPHQDLDKLQHLLRSTRERSPAMARVVVVTESVFSMDGDLCPLAEIVELKDRHGAWLLLDEAHAFGVLGPQGLGLAEALGLQARVELQLGTLSKAAGLAGAYLAAHRAVINLLVNRARSFVYSTAPPPALACAALRSLELIRSAEGTALRRRLRQNLERWRRLRGLPITHDHPVPIHPLLLGTNEAALAASRQLEQLGFLAPAIRYPTVPRGTARLRLSFSAAHPPRAIDGLAQALPPPTGGR